MSNSTAAASPPTSVPTRRPPLCHSSGPAAKRNVPAKSATWINTADWIAAVLITVVTVALHARFVTHVGALWRDEVNSVNLATLPLLKDVWHSLEFDSFPLLFFTLLRSWIGLFGVHNDFALRLLGLLIGLGIVAAIWVTTRTLGSRTPVLSLALIGLNPMLIRYGDSTRAYGLGILLILLTFASFGRLITSASAPTRRCVLTTAALAIASVHSIYYNAVLLFAIISASIVVCGLKRSWRTATIAFSIGLVAAGSLLPYVPIIRRMGDWTFLVGYPVDLAFLWKRSCEVFGSPDPVQVGIWVTLFAASVGIAATLLFVSLKDRPAATGATNRRSSDHQVRLPDSVLFAAVALIIAVPAYAAFLRMLGYYTQPWYYITLAAFAACAIDVVFGAWPLSSCAQGPPLLVRAARPLVALGLLCLTAFPDWKEITTRHTNIDMVAAQLRSLAKDGDVVLVPQWENAISLSYHYPGPAKIVTIPAIADHRFHRYDLVLREMVSGDPVPPINAQLERALRSNHAVFIAGNLTFPPMSAHLRKTYPAPAKRDHKWNRYYTFWQLHIGQFVRVHGNELDKVATPVAGAAAIQDFENVELHVVRGWREDS